MSQVTFKADFKAFSWGEFESAKLKMKNELLSASCFSSPFFSQSDCDLNVAYRFSEFNSYNPIYFQHFLDTVAHVICHHRCCHPMLHYQSSVQQAPNGRDDGRTLLLKAYVHLFGSADEPTVHGGAATAEAERRFPPTKYL